MFCREQVARFTERRADIEANGASLAVIGNGTALMARDFAEKFSVCVPLFTDPERKSYDVARWRRPTASAVLKLGTTLKASVRAMKGGFRQGKTQGDAFQLGGVLVLDPSGEILFEHGDAAAGDHASIDAVLDVLAG